MNHQQSKLLSLAKIIGETDPKSTSFENSILLDKEERELVKKGSQITKE